MSSLFTFNSSPSPPSSPWSLATPADANTRTATPTTSLSSVTVTNLAPGVRALISEPQDGSTEYKLSLLHPSPVRLRHLTTQMLWRLQQSCPSHNTAGLPALVDDKEKIDRSYYAALLQDSQGCFYEIGVADDGRLLGLVQEELDQSLSTLSQMADTLGCTMKVLRRVMVGEISVNDETKPLFVAEARITPFQFERMIPEDLGPPQLRVTLTGPTASGKSSLVGTLTTSTLDNGRGKSRLSLLKHRHEIESGITSSIANELIGFSQSGEVINYRTANVDSWMDIHAAVGAHAEDNARTVLLVDSAGMYRYRRTAIRGMIGWAPHYTAIVLASSDDVTDSSIEYLTLCLKLRLRFFLIINKLDLASSAGLRKLCKTVFDHIRIAGLEPKVIAESANGDGAKKLLNTHHDAIVEGSIIPILFVSAVSGKGVENLLTLLNRLPIPKLSNGSSTLFHIEETFEASTGIDLVIAGHMRHGRIAMSDEVVLGPFPTTPGWSTPSSSYADSGKWSTLAQTADKKSTHADDAEQVGEWRTARVASIRQCRLPVGMLNPGEVGTIGIVWNKEPKGANDLAEELETTYLSVVAPIPTKTQKSVSFGPSPVPTPHLGSSADTRVRKGMVILSKDSTPIISTGFVAEFASADEKENSSLTIGSTVIVYFGSVRAAAKVSSREILPIRSACDVFDLDEGEIESGHVRYAFKFMNTIEWIESGCTVLVMDTGRGNEGLASGLGAGTVGKIVDTED